MILDVKQAISAYTSARQAHISTVTALHTGAGAMIASGAAIAGVGATMVAGFGVAINAAAQFEKKLDFFGAVSSATQDEYDAIRQKALQLGADTIFSANQIADSFIELGKSGIGAKDIIDGIGEAVANLGAAADIPLDTAANIITSAVATFQLGAADAVGVADKLAGAANASIVDVTDLGVSLKYAGGVASSLKVPFADVNTALAILGVNGIKGSTAGTSLRQILLGLNGSTKKAKVALQELGIITADGANEFYNAQGAAKPLSEIFQILQDKMAGMTDKQKTSTMQTIFATRALPSLIALTREGAAGFSEMAAAIDKTTALDVASKRLDNLSGDIEILRGNIDTMLVSSGSGFQTFARFVVQNVTKVIQAFIDLPPAIQTAGLAITASLGGLLIVVGTLGMFAGAITNIIALAIQMAPVWAAMARIWVAVSGAIKLASAAMVASPWGIVIGLIILLAGALFVLWNTSEDFRNAVAPLLDGLKSAFAAIGPIVTDLVGKLVALLTTVGNGAQGAGKSFLDTIVQLAGVLGGVLSSALQTILPIFMNLVNLWAKIFLPVLQTLMPILMTIGQIFGSVLAGNMQAVPGLIQQLADGFLGFVSVLSTQVIPMVLQLVTNIIVTLIGMLPVIIQAGVSLFVGLVQSLAIALPQILTGLLAGLTTIITTLTTLLPMLINVGITIFNGLIQSLLLILPQVIQAGVTLFTGLIQALVTILPILIQTAISLILVLITALVTMLPMLIQAAIMLFMGILQALVQVIPQVIQALVTAIPLIINALVQAIPLIINAAITLFLGIITALLTALPQIISALVNAIPLLIRAITSALPQLISGAIQLFLGIITGLMRALPQVISAIIGIIPQLVGAIIDAVPQFLDAGVQLIQGLMNGIASMAGQIGSFFLSLLPGWIVGPFKAAMGINSPSKLFHSFGVYLIQGLVNGIHGMQRAAVNAVQGMADSIASVPMALSDLTGLNDAVTLTKKLAIQASVSQVGVGSTQAQTTADLLDALDNLRIENKYDIVVNNPEPEPASDSLPRSVRKLAYMVG